MKIPSLKCLSLLMIEKFGVLSGNTFHAIQRQKSKQDIEYLSI